MTFLSIPFKKVPWFSWLLSCKNLSESPIRLGRRMKKIKMRTKQTGHWCSIKILPSNSFVWSPQLPQPLLKSIHMCMWVLWSRDRQCDRRRGNLDLTMQSERYSLWCWLTGWRGWRYHRVILYAILRQGLLGLLPIYPLAEASYSILNKSHGQSKLIDGNHLWIHISLIWSLV